MSNALSNDQMMELMGGVGEVRINRIGHEYASLLPWRCTFTLAGEEGSLTTQFEGDTYVGVVAGLFNNVKHLIIGE